MTPPLGDRRIAVRPDHPGENPTTMGEDSHRQGQRQRGSWRSTGGAIRGAGELAEHDQDPCRRIRGLAREEGGLAPADAWAVKSNGLRDGKTCGPRGPSHRRRSSSCCRAPGRCRRLGVQLGHPGAPKIGSGPGVQPGDTGHPCRGAEGGLSLSGGRGGVSRDKRLQRGVSRGLGWRVMIDTSMSLEVALST